MRTLSSTIVMVGFLLGFGFAQIEAQDIPNGIMPNKRQAVGTGVTTSPSSSPTTSHTSQTSQKSSNTPSSSRDQSSSPTTASATRSSTPTHVTVSTTNPDGSSTTHLISTGSSSSSKQTTKKTNSFVTLSSTTINAATLSHKTTVRSPLVTVEPTRHTYTSHYTVDGSVHSTVYTSTGEHTTTTGYTKHTIDPSLADGGGNGSNLSTNTKSVIGGVVGGVGGAVVVGALAFVLFRVRNNRKKQEDIDGYTDPMSQTGRESQMTFGSEGYSHIGRVNTSSNF